ncbi:hypothetical protein [Kingella sp. (in: b-proteobacteria)]|uniref:hypothetical protein n=1 Tax=Kingella sp. (in: b-proteobacteria) TaxID=2020713 RepID=UPI0026DC58CE|nr:hypothetical protein [Kingella sp. (in: b-proteobacteria)]
MWVSLLMGCVFRLPFWGGANRQPENRVERRWFVAKWLVKRVRVVCQSVGEPLMFRFQAAFGGYKWAA